MRIGLALTVIVVLILWAATLVLCVYLDRWRQ